MWKHLRKFAWDLVCSGLGWQGWAGMWLSPGWARLGQARLARLSGQGCALRPLAALGLASPYLSFQILELLPRFLPISLRGFVGLEGDPGGDCLLLPVPIPLLHLTQLWGALWEHFKA